MIIKKDHTGILKEPFFTKYNERASKWNPLAKQLRMLFNYYFTLLENSSIGRRTFDMEAR